MKYIHSYDCFCATCRGEAPPHRLADADPPAFSDSEIGKDCMGNVCCTKCGRRFGYCAEILNEEKNKTMLPDENESKPRPKKGGGGIEYIRNEHLSKQPKEAKVIAVKIDAENKFGPRIILKLAMDGKTMFWGVNIKKNPNYRLLLDKFGKDENDWIEKRILLGLEQDDFSGNYFARVSFPKSK